MTFPVSKLEEQILGKVMISSFIHDSYYILANEWYSCEPLTRSPLIRFPNFNCGLRDGKYDIMNTYNLLVMELLTCPLNFTARGILIGDSAA